MDSSVQFAIDECMCAVNLNVYGCCTCVRFFKANNINNVGVKFRIEK